MASEEGGCLPEETEFPPDKTDASGEDGLVKEAVRRGDWDQVADLLVREVNLSKEQTEFVFDEAHGVWEQVIRLACASVTRESDLHLVFLEAVRRGKWRWALQLCKKAKGLRFPLVRLLHESGSSSSHEMHLLKNNASIRTQLESQNRQDIVHVLLLYLPGCV
nr:hypothetical protein BaRGS_018790 [Batillaria attramentaria]